MGKRTLLFVMMAIVLLGAGLAACGKLEERPAVQSIEEGWTEPTFASGAATVTVQVRYPKNLQALVDYADTIIAGDIVSINETSKSFHMEEGTPERAISEKIGGGSSFTVNGRDIVIAISDTFKGKPEGSEVTLNIHNVAVSLDPELQAGESYILFLRRDEASGKYTSAHFSAGYFSINKEQNRVHPLYTEAPEFSQLNNQSYEQVIKLIKEKAS